MSKRRKNIWSVAGLFLILLVITMPIFSADAMAVSVQITKNSGQAGIEGVLDASSDVWTVEALVSGVSAESNNSISPDDVKIIINKNSDKFKTCSSDSLGVMCKYSSPLTNGVKEGAYNFKIVYEMLKDEENYNKNPGASSVILADGSIPKINDLKVIQDKGMVRINFAVTDIYDGKTSAGLKSIEVSDAESGKVLEKVENLDKSIKEYSYSNAFVSPWKEEGIKKIKVIAFDQLGHQSSAVVKDVLVDFIAPVVKDETLNFASMGKFIGDVIITTNLQVDVIEKNMLVSVKGSSDQIQFLGVDAECNEDVEKVELWHCMWKNVEVKPEAGITLKIMARDEAGNVVEKQISKGFVKDSNAPEIDFFGTEHQYKGRSYIATNGNARIILKVKEQGAGINESGIRLNLKALGKSVSEAPSECGMKEGLFTCYWDVYASFGSDTIVKVGLSKFQDNVGNEGKMPEIEVVVDGSAPKVQKAELYGVSEVGDKQYFQSNDQLKIKISVAEVSGLAVLVNMNDLMMDAESKLPVMDYTREEGTGWQVFTEKECQRNEEAKTWECVFVTNNLRSGPDSGVKVEVKVKDTAGNSAMVWEKEPKNIKSGGKGNYILELLGLSTETSPDYWEGKSTLVSATSFIDLDTTQLTSARIPFNVQLDSKQGKVQALKVEVIGCENAGESLAFVNISENKPVISRALLYGGKFITAVSEPKPTVVLEFASFEGKKLFNVGEKGKSEELRKEISYKCQLKIFSQVGDNALQNAEMQEVVFKVPFAFSSLGADNANLDAKIQEAKDDAGGAWKVIGTLNKVLHWVDYGVQIVSIVKGVIALLSGVKPVADSAKAIPWAEGGRIAVCFGLNGMQETADKGVNALDQIVQVLSCRPLQHNIGTESSSNNQPFTWYGKWQNSILSLYNVELLKDQDSPLGAQQKLLRPARNVKDNLYLSVASLCLPGIIKNLDKYRQIKCRKVYCLQNEVKAGLATVDQCDRLENLLTCKYFFGELWYVFPFSQFWDKGIRAIWDALKDPFATAHTLTIGYCGISCSISGTASRGCDYALYIWQWIDELESIAGFIVTIKDDISSGGLQYCDSVL